jgi:hypothetical protein
MRPISMILAAGVAVAATPAAAEPVKLKPIVDARLRYEGVEQAGLPGDADAVTLRLRSGVEVSTGPWSALVEGEGTLAINGRYNSTTNGRSLYPVVPDPENVEVNRVQLQYRGLAKTVVTVGRQRINLDDQRFVGSVAWRQNEQTFDAVRIESAALGPVSVDLTYSWSDRTIFGIDSALQAIGGDNVLASAAIKLGPVTAKGFAYLVDQDKAGRRQLSSQTYGLRAIGVFPLAKATKLTLTGSYARQSDYADNPNSYAADYYLGEAALSVKGLTLTGGYELLGASSGAPFTSFQTPLATLHKFQGWADKFLTTPGNGIRDLYASGGYAIPHTPAGPVSMLVAWHRFESDRLSIVYGHEWNAQVGFKPGKHTALLIKFADYQAKSFATDTQKLWLQLDYML